MRFNRAVLVVALIAACAAAWLVIREQRTANARLQTMLGEVSAALDDQTRSRRELEQQVARLSDRVISLEQALARSAEALAKADHSRRFTGSPKIARALPAPIDAVALAPLSPSPKSQAPSPIVIETLPITWATDWTSYQPAGIVAQPAPIALERRLTDPAFMKKMYIAFGALQAADIVTTTVALNRGAREGNPVMRGVANSPGALIGVKAAVSVATIVAMEKLRQKRPVLTSVTLIALNATLAAVVINNASVGAGAPSRRAE